MQLQLFARKQMNYGMIELVFLEQKVSVAVWTKRYNLKAT